MACFSLAVRKDEMARARAREAEGWLYVTQSISHSYYLLWIKQKITYIRVQRGAYGSQTYSEMNPHETLGKYKCSESTNELT
jgi:hypothetical protein